MVIGLVTPTRPGLAERVCSGCGGILDAPRPAPGSGRMGRKCAGCKVWYGPEGPSDAEPPDHAVREQLQAAPA